MGLNVKKNYFFPISHFPFPISLILFSSIFLSCGKDPKRLDSAPADQNSTHIYNRAITESTDIGFLPLPESPVFSEVQGSSPRSLDLAPEGVSRASGYVLTGLGKVPFSFRFLVMDTNNSLISGGGWNLANNDVFVKRNLLSGDIDTSFNTSGALTHSISTATDLVIAGVLQTDGKLVAVGYGVGSNYDFALARYTTDGKLDTSFRTSGKVNSSISTGIDVAYGAVLQTDGMVVAVGYGVGSNNDFALARYTTDGKLDTSFFTSGKLLSSISTGDDATNALVLQRDGKMVAAGQATGSDGDFALARYTSDGRLDTSFFTSGKLLNSVGTSFDSAYGVAIQTNGKILAVGFTATGAAGDRSYSILRYLTNGILDTTFKTTGKFIGSIRGQGDVLYSIKLDPSTGYLYVAGQSTRAVDGDAVNAGTFFLLMRIAP